MRIISDSPIEIPKAAVLGHLGPPIWTTPDQIFWVTNPNTRTPERIRTCFTDQTLSTPVDTTGFGTSKRIRFSSDNDQSFLIAALLAPVLPDTNLLLFVTVSLDLLFAVQTDAAFRKDGIIQISGHEMGISLLTGEQMLAQRGRKLMR